MILINSLMNQADFTGTNCLLPHLGKLSPNQLNFCCVISLFYYTELACLTSKWMNNIQVLNLYSLPLCYQLYLHKNTASQQCNFCFAILYIYIYIVVIADFFIHNEIRVRENKKSNFNFNSKYGKNL